jgi:hypothetical protein
MLAGAWVPPIGNVGLELGGRLPFDEFHQGVEGSVTDFLQWRRHLSEVAGGIEIVEAALATRMEFAASVENRAGP